ncbi:hypothetical protein [Pandoraea capi]|uniref:hypothetical protein n=1 Tax=Pandoraea capi TaxID=2508286 RepID=UPI001FE5F391|nr:hypothetical protein [Pandoraea capi]
MTGVEHLDDILRDSFGLWISGLFSSIGAWNPKMTFEEKKEAFFGVVYELLEKGRVKFIAPGADCYVSPKNPHPSLTIFDESAHWREPPGVIVKKLRSRWPPQVKDENDVELAVYFYSIPAIIWVRDDGSLVAS